MWSGYLFKILGGTEVEINGKKINITPGIQKVLTDTSNIPLTKWNEKNREIFNNVLENLDFENHKATRGESKSGRYKHSKTMFKKRVNNSDLDGQEVKIIIPSNIIDICTRLEVLLGLKLSGHTNTLAEVSNLIGELYKRREIQNEQQYRNALKKFHT